jgi:hypothetical protein
MLLAEKYLMVFMFLGGKNLGNQRKLIRNQIGPKFLKGRVLTNHSTLHAI